MFCLIFYYFYAGITKALVIYQLCQSLPGTAQGQARISRDKRGRGRDKQGETGTFPFGPCLSLLVPVCPCLSLLVLVCPCMSLSVLVCPCLSLYVSTFAIPSCLPLQMNITVLISMNIVTLTYLAKGAVPMHENLVLFNLLYFSSCFLNNSFIQSNQFYSSDKYHRGLHVVSSIFFFFKSLL